MKNIFDLTEKFSNYQNSKFVIVPVPHEKTTSYGKGTKHGPRAILKASHQVELYDPELDCEPYQQGIHLTKKTALPKLSELTKKIALDHKLPVILGGEHSISTKVVAGLKEVYPDLSVIQFDAHSDMREFHAGDKDSHATVMYRIREDLSLKKTLSIGVRSQCIEEKEYIKKNKVSVLYAHQINNHLNSHVEASLIRSLHGYLKKLSKNVYLTIDLDVFDPSILPATGTPEPGGLNWYQVLVFLKEIYRTKNVVGFDLVELEPNKYSRSSEFLAAKLLYKNIGYYYLSGGIER